MRNSINFYSFRSAIVLLVLIFVADIFLPVDVALGALYAAPVALSAREERRKIITISLLASALTIGVLLLNIQRIDSWMIYANRLISLAVIWVACSITVFQNTYHLLKTYKSGIKEQSTEILLQRNILYTLIDNVPLYIGIFDKQGRYTMVNKNYESAFFMKREEIIGKRLRDIIPEKNVDTYEPMLNKALGGEEVEFYERTEMKNGSVIYAHGKYIPIFDENHRVNYVTVALLDVTRLEETKRALEIANETKNKILGTLAHDIRNPITNLQSLLEASSSAMIGKDEFEGFVDKIKNQFLPIYQSIEELLNWSRVQLDGMEPNPSSLDLNQALSVQIDSFRPQINAKNQTIIFENVTAVIGYADPVHVNIIVRNVIHNAIKFSPENSTITITAKTVQDWAIIEVKDSGVGMSDDVIQKVLDGKFVKSVAGTLGEKGTGLGLNLALELVKKNRGEVQINSKADSGTIFTIALPQASMQ